MPPHPTTVMGSTQLLVVVSRRRATLVVVLGTCQGTAFKGPNATIARASDTLAKTARSPNVGHATHVAPKAIFPAIALGLRWLLLRVFEFSLICGSSASSFHPHL
ncbi:hypothetical protein AcW1_006139 [Taiwanofungus camphoratus]|nr:hypothetical protein AcW1_006139 [Antrodia cinnamomea]